MEDMATVWSTRVWARLEPIMEALEKAGIRHCVEQPAYTVKVPVARAVEARRIVSACVLID